MSDGEDCFSKEAFDPWDGESYAADAEAADYVTSDESDYDWDVDNPDVSLWNKLREPMSARDLWNSIVTCRDRILPTYKICGNRGEKPYVLWEPDRSAERATEVCNAIQHLIGWNPNYVVKCTSVRWTMGKLISIYYGKCKGTKTEMKKLHRVMRKTLTAVAGLYGESLDTASCGDMMGPYGLKLYFPATWFQPSWLSDNQDPPLKLQASNSSAVPKTSRSIPVDQRLSPPPSTEGAGSFLTRQLFSLTLSQGAAKGGASNTSDPDANTNRTPSETAADNVTESSELMKTSRSPVDQPLSPPPSSEGAGSFLTRQLFPLTLSQGAAKGGASKNSEQQVTALEKEPGGRPLEQAESADESLDYVIRMLERLSLGGRSSVRGTTCRWRGW